MSTSQHLPQATLSPSRTHAPSWVHRTATIALVALTSTFAVVVGATPASAAPPIDTVPLGLVSTFAVLTPAAVGNDASEPATVLRGDVGSGGAFTGFPPGVYTGTLYEGVATAAPLADLQIAFDNAKARPVGAVMPGELGGTTAGPGVHTAAAASGMAAGGTFTIDGEGDPDAVFIFQVGGALALGANITMNLTRGAQAHNVYWAVTGAGAIGADAMFVGTLIATTAVSSGAGSTINGRLLSLGGAITMSSTQLYSSPPTVTIDGGQQSTSMTSSPTITGSTSLRSPATVAITVDGASVTPSPTVSATGTWSFASAELANGNHTVVASVVDGADNVGSFTQILNIDTEPPAVTIDGGLAFVTNDLTPTVSGTTDVAAGELVTVTFTDATSTTVTRSTLVQDDLTWNLTPNGLTGGEWTIVATVTDTAGNQNTATQRLLIDATAPNLSITSSALTNDPTPAISGTTEAGSTVAVTVDGVTVAGVIVTGTNWTAQTTVTLAHGTHHVSVAATDIAGNTTSPSATQSLMVDLSLPIIAINPGPTDATNDRTPTIAGTTDLAPGPGVIVSVSIDGGAPLTALVQPDGWNVTPSEQLTPGDHNLVATASDPAGNIGSSSQTLTIDIEAPSVSVDGGPSRTTTDATPTITGSAPDVPVGSPVTVTIYGQTLMTTIVLAGTFSVTAAALPNATHFAFVTVTDAAGNIGNANQALTVNAVPPTVTYTHGAAFATNDATPLISGSTDASAGSTVTVTADGQTLRATVQPGGSWNVTAAHIGNGDVTIVTEITDASGNIGTATQLLTIDTVEPVVDVPPTVETADPTPPISGSGATPGSTVTVTVSGQTMTTTVAEDGTWTVTPTTPLPAGDNEVTITIAEPAGNIATTTQIITITEGPPTTTPQFAEYTSVGPMRVFDTRAGASADTLRSVPAQQVGGAYELRVKMTDLAGFIPASGVGAVSLNVTSTGSTADGFITVYACGMLEEVSSVNFRAGRTVANAVIAPVSPTGNVCFYALNATDIVVDVNGWFAAGAGFHDVGPKRVFDTRAGASPDALRDVAKSKLLAGTTMEVRLTDLSGYVPTDGVGSVSLNVVVTNPEAPGFVTVYACGTMEEVSSVNYNGAGETVANAVIAPVSANGTICFYTLANTDLVVDINGWIESGSDFHGVDPARLLDTRAGSSPDALSDVTKAKIGRDNVLEVQVTNLPGLVPAAGVTAVSLNVTATNTEAPGFITVFACGTMEEVSSVNFNGAGQTVANAVIAPVSSTGTICFYALNATDLVVDINGWIGTG
jgi:hypothetical protein